MHIWEKLIGTIFAIGWFQLVFVLSLKAQYSKNLVPMFDAERINAKNWLENQIWAPRLQRHGKPWYILRQLLRLKEERTSVHLWTLPSMPLGKGMDAIQHWVHDPPGPSGHQQQCPCRHNFHVRKGGHFQAFAYQLYRSWFLWMYCWMIPTPCHGHTGDPVLNRWWGRLFGGGLWKDAWIFMAIDSVDLVEDKIFHFQSLSISFQQDVCSFSRSPALQDALSTRFAWVLVHLDTSLLINS